MSQGILSQRESQRVVEHPCLSVSKDHVIINKTHAFVGVEAATCQARADRLGLVVRSADTAGIVQERGSTCSLLWFHDLIEKCRV